MDEWKDKVLSRLVHAAALFLAAVCWTALRFQFTREFTPASYARIYDFTAAVPFGKRVLAPILAHLGTWAGLGILPSFALLEIFSVMALCFGLERVFRLYGDGRMARFLGMGIFAVLPWLFLAPCHWSLLFPWDLPAMAFTAWGVWAVLAGRWKTLCCLMVFASFNRESAVLLPLAWGAAWAGRRTWGSVLGVAALLSAIYLLCQAAIVPTLADNLPYYQLHGGMNIRVGESWRLLNNWRWLTGYHAQRVVVLLGTLAGIPVAFAFGMRRFPVPFRRLGLVAWVYFGMLMVVGSIWEARIYCEITVLLYAPVALWIWERATGVPVLANAGNDDGTSGIPAWMAWAEALVALGVPAGVALLGWAFAHGWGG